MGEIKKIFMKEYGVCWEGWEDLINIGFGFNMVKWV